jgi:predicted dinucleotide-binding enzyme
MAMIQREIREMKNVQNEVSVIGWGIMGPTLTQLLLRKGYRVTVGNRTGTNSENYEISESPLRISVEATERLAQAPREDGINFLIPTFAPRLFKRAAAAGHEEEVAGLIKVLRAAPNGDSA